MLVNSKVLYRIEPFYFNDDYNGIQLQDGFRLYHFNKQFYYQYIQQLFFVENQNGKTIAKTYITDWNQVSKITFKNRLDNNEMTSFPGKKCEYRYYVNYDENNTGKIQRCIYFKIENIQIIASMSHVGMVVYEFSIERMTESKKMNDESTFQEVEMELTPQNYEWAVYALRSIHQVKKNAIQLQVENKENKEQRAAYFKAKNFHLPEPEKIPYIFKPFDWCELTNAIISKFFKEPYGFAESQKPGRYALMYTGAMISQQDENDKKELVNHLFKISRGYKHTYYKHADLEDVIQPFDNVWWYFSDEGASSFVLEMNDQAAMSFFESQYTSKWSTNYFYMYILVLIQKFSFIYYTIKTNERLENSILYKDGTHKIEEIELELLETRKLYQTILKFQIQAYHEQISQLTHYNLLYTQLFQKLHIPELRNELTKKLETFSRVIESIATEKLTHEKQKQEAEAALIFEQKQEQIRLEEKDREERKEQVEKQNKVIQTITYILLPATLTTGILGMNIPFIAQSKNILFLPVIFAVIACTALMSMLINKIEWITSKMVLVVSSIILIICLFLALEDYKQTEKVEEKVLFEELCEKVEGCSYVEG
ncbi:hypothetical protein [Niallia sp. Krafla_26]|uniref:hypothetical protein n=1 Tax=Niallia sp. Krafla_26 TaxID=3064703 RepID=UPI003D187257